MSSTVTAFAVVAETPGAIFTASDTLTSETADAFIVVGDKIASIGTKDHVRQQWSHIAKSYNIEQVFDDLDRISIPAGQMVGPGFIGSHLHFLEGGESLLAPLSAAKTKKEFLDMVGEYAKSNESEGIIRLNGFSHTNWTDAKGALPTAQDFEDHLGADGKPDMAGRKIIISSRDCHMQVQWLYNGRSKKETGGVVELNPDGSASGVFKDNAQRILFDKRAGTQYTADQLRERFKRATDECLKYGITTQTDAGLRYWSLDHYLEIVQSNQAHMLVRTYAMLYTEPSEPEFTLIPPGNGLKDAAAYKDLGGNRLCVRAVKIFADGAMRSFGAQARPFALFLSEPYEDDSNNSGFPLATMEDFTRVIEMAFKQGLQPAIHAIGDAAISSILEILEKLMQKLGLKGDQCRPRIEHAQILNRKDGQRFADLGVIASIQPSHVHGDMDIGLARLGPERANKCLYAFRELLQHGVKYACGTDWPVENLDPMNTLLNAIRPRDDDPEKSLTVKEALLGMTRYAAYACRNEHLVGSLEVGKLADFVILNKDIVSIEPADLLQHLQANSVTVLATYIGGAKEYQSARTD
ncbi:hypothetical protein BDZ89DRAFT_1144920 [Hymenopellis radicata]|nr:hypothetical protein BDZ89DRAFT_1144920 [Hymenopellis radicata]